MKPFPPILETDADMLPADVHPPATIHQNTLALDVDRISD